ncbi:MAG: mechanosensitive ion channel protein MscS [Omnitrophica WOR_2 bacterium GWF2_38_59]|nr:MAG: mechanosensitive ion channel protein MscS [Omnitrophica WOR_2 bacterium GWF2_38_59]OGX47680.1 MAG: mechanosensitive ion channel protein MscS [Omnitrophica WOR_2 bacterium RIFOXYA2_FULL_38_17]OGX54762.1 MAG: mechanosensitive ion channel protein MscS [Omnitrophica WOR_2 bacterium RIFOXYA12_FULL_38_10]OGX57789.1 MAG: mechanosensitive ion channel protein MscS [Omnitrophica WOR_2 bacterium RIFOXYC2_FULL_38_12]OGX58575.1 MAG: mechanosensitive ion channel protein MscS [Omnitrophica WOR_2 bacte
MLQIMNKIILGNTIQDYAECLVFFLFGVIFVNCIERVIIKKFKALSEKTETTIDDFILRIIRRVLLPFTYASVGYLSVISLNLDPFLKKGLGIAVILILTFVAARFITTIINYLFTVYWKKRGQTAAMEGSLRGILMVINFLIWALAIIFFLDNMGFKISAVIAGLGIGGVAVALAAQAVLADLFSYFAILFDRPFEIGDFIIVGDYLGVVEHVGVKTTRISSLSGEQIVFSNTDLTNSRVRNYKRMQKRRVVFKLGVTYNTSLEKVKEIPKIIEGIVKGIKDTTFDRAHFLAYGDFSLVYEVVYYVMSGDYNKYMDIQQEINFEIKNKFKEKQIEFAFPTQTLYVNKES